MEIDLGENISDVKLRAVQKLALSGVSLEGCRLRMTNWSHEAGALIEEQVKIDV